MGGAPVMTFHEMSYAMVVMDGNRAVAKARQTPHGYILRTYNGCWTDPRARSQGLFPGKFPYLLVVKRRDEARRILKGLIMKGHPNA